ncbi:MAG: PIN domain-containing protein [Terriglobia bacterium]
MVYTVDPSEPEKQPIAASLLRRTIKNRTLVLSPQSLNECYRVITDRRRLLDRNAAREFIADLSESCTAPLDYAVTRLAWQIQDRTNFAIWDCLLLASASLAGCEIFLSEDMQHDHRILNVRIINPFVLPHLQDLPI